MNTPYKLVSTCVLLLACTFASAQDKEADKPKTDEKPKAEKKEPKVKVGDKAPVLKVDHLLHEKVKSLSEFKGRLVFYEYFQHW